MANPSGGAAAGTGRADDPGVTARESPLLLDDVRFDRHAAGAYHPERPERLLAARAALATEGVSFTRVPAREAHLDELALAHEEAFLVGLAKLRGTRAQIDPDTYVGPASVEAAWLAAGGLVDLTEGILRGAATQGVALVRPPGHHARPAQAMGFCLLNNVAVAAAHARKRGLARVAIVDWDVHHGNGTQDIFYADPSVLYVSLHQYPFYPGTGAAEEAGVGEGTGYTVNVPLDAGGGDAIYRGAFERIVLPILDNYAPELLLVSAGFDAAKRDPLAGMNVSSDGFAWMANALVGVARRHAGGKIAWVLEGGYDLVALEAGLRAVSSAAFAGKSVEIARDADHDDLARAAEAAGAYWKL